MRKIVLAICMAVATGLCGARAATNNNNRPTAPRRGSAAEYEAVNQASIKAQNGDFQGVIDILEPAVADPAFSLLNSRQQFLVRRMLGGAYLTVGKDEKAIAFLKQVTASQWATGIDWYLRLLASYAQKDKEHAIKCLTKLAELWPDTLSQLNDDVILRLAFKSRKSGSDRERALLEALAAANWHPTDLFDSMDGIRIELARLRLEEGRTAAALEAIAGLDSPWPIVAIRADKRFDSLVKQSPARFDMDRVFTLALANAKKRAAAMPNRLAGVNDVARLLLAKNRTAEALSLLDDALARANRHDSQTQPFSDLSKQLTWAMDLKSRALKTLGREDEAVDELRHAARRPEDGKVNVSQSINLSDLYNELGRPKDALDEVAELNSAPMSAYGRMALTDARACAYAQLNDVVRLAKTMAYMKDHASDGARAYLDALLCANDLDGAAKLIIAELKAPERRMAMLELLQNYDEPTHMAGPGRALHHRMLAVRDRTDVRAEIADVGRIERYHLQSPWY